MSYKPAKDICCSNCAHSIRHTRLANNGCPKNKQSECLKGFSRTDKVTDGSTWYVNRVKLSYTKFVPYTLLDTMEEGDLFSDEDFLI